jgi:amino acid transporter
MQSTNRLSRIKAAAKGANGDVNDAGIPPARYNRNLKRAYPYKSRGQWLKAAYGCGGCCLLALFNGWRSFAPSFSRLDFVASYISVMPAHPFLSRSRARLLKEICRRS